MHYCFKVPLQVLIIVNMYTHSPQISHTQHLHNEVMYVVNSLQLRQLIVL